MPPVPHWHRGRMVLVGDAVHAPSNSTGQGASLAIESAIQLARCLRDLPDAASAFAAYEGLRRERVEKITKRGARINHAKTPGPVGPQGDARADADHLQDDELREVDGARAALSDRLGCACDRRDFGGCRVFLISRLSWPCSTLRTSDTTWSGSRSSTTA